MIIKDYLVNDLQRDIDFDKQIIQPIKELIFISFQAVKNKINSQSRKNCFEIYGYDFISDQDLKMWLIEVNTNPCIEESSQLLCKLMPRMIGKKGFVIIKKLNK